MTTLPVLNTTTAAPNWLPEAGFGSTNCVKDNARAAPGNDSKAHQNTNANDGM
jgi:hypothetical protein